jgi:hypothetical protein
MIALVLVMAVVVVSFFLEFVLVWIERRGE